MSDSRQKLDSTGKAEAEPFLSRWSRRKIEAREAPAVPAGEATPATVETQEAGQPADRAPELPPVDELTIDSDFRGFFHPKVDEDVRRSALRKLFSDPHFNVMDGLDTYIDDYSISEPIPPEMLAGLRQARKILQWAEGRDDEDEDEPAAEAQPDGEPIAALEDASTPDGAPPMHLAEPVELASPDEPPVSDPTPEALAKPS